MATFIVICPLRIPFVLVVSNTRNQLSFSSILSMTSVTSDTTPIPLQLDLDYVDATHDACFAWLKEKYATLLPAAATAAAPAGTTTTAAARDTTGKENDASVLAENRKFKKPQLDKALLQGVENDIAACDALRWRVFAFPSHPTQALHSSYHNGPGKKDGPTALTAQLHKVKKSTHKNTSDAPEESKSADAAATSRYALVISTRASADAKKKAKKQQKNKAKTAVGSASAAAPLHVEEMMEKLVWEEEQARRCRLLGESDVTFIRDATRATNTTSNPRKASWGDRWIPQSWRPLLGGYVSAPISPNSARFLLFPQSAHPAVDFRDPAASSLPPGKSLADPQSVPYYLRGSVHWDVEKNNPAAAAVSTGDDVAATSPQGSNALSYSVHGARRKAAPATPHLRNWADAVDVSVAARQSRTERQYAPEREKVQRVALLEDSAVVKISRGNPRYGLSVTVAHATVLNSGVKHQHDATPDVVAASESKKKSKKAKLDSLASLAVVEDDYVEQLQVQDTYDSSVQYFALPHFWQRLVRSSLSHTSVDGTAETGTGTQVLDTAPRGQYRVRWSGGPGVEGCRVDCPVQPQQQHLRKKEFPSTLLTVFGKLWTESWLEVPLPWQMALKLRTQTAVTMPLLPSQPIWPPMVPDTAADSAALPAPAETRGESFASRLCEHPYFWATQGPRWDAALVRGFKNDYSGMHHARRWYSILSAELTLNGNTGKPSGSDAAAATAAPKTSLARASSGEDSLDEAAAAVAVAAGEEEEADVVAPRPIAASRWRNTTLTAFANACMVDTLKDYPRASVGFSFASKIPRIAITPFNEIIPHKFECSFSWFAAFKANTSNAEGASRGFNVEFVSGTQPPQQQSGAGTAAASTADGMPFLRVSPVETFHHMKCGLTWRFDD